MSTSFVFGRPTNGTHALDPFLSALKRGSVTTRALAVNIMRDERVCPKRERPFVEILERVCAEPANAGKDEAEILTIAFQEYRDAFLAGNAIHDPHRETAQVKKPQPLFAAEDQNCLNLLNGKPERARPPQGTLLANVLDLCGLDAVYRYAAQRPDNSRTWKKILSDYPTNARPSAIADWLDRYLLDQNEQTETDKQTFFVRETLKALNHRREAVGPFQPLWATTWNDFQRRVEGQGPESWLESTGLGREDPRRWLIVLVYPVDSVRWLARPTQLDAGWYGYHFPSPPCLPATNGGHPMDLQIDPCPKSLLAEFIHEQIPYDYQHWDDGGRQGPNRLIGCTNDRTPDELLVQRHNHYRRLMSNYEPMRAKIVQWMPDPV